MSNATATALPAAAGSPPVGVAGTADGRMLAVHCVVADTPARRMRGLLGRDGLDAGEGLLIRPSNAIHMWFMRFPIDAVFLDADGTVLRIAASLRPWRTAFCRGARAVLELPAGTCAALQLEPGERVAVVTGDGTIA